MIGGLVDCIGIKSSRVQAVQLVNAGAGYTLSPGVVFIGGGGSGAAKRAGTAHHFLSDGCAWYSSALCFLHQRI
jgi:hypothetical protein